MKSFKDLITDVHKKGICQQCGGCVSFCNSIEHAVIGFKDPYSPPAYMNIDKCLRCGICYLICPQTHSMDKEINETYKFTEYESLPLGFYFNIHSCQSNDDDFLKNGTDGGVVNTLLNYLLEKEIIDGAIVAKTIAPFCREVMIAKSRKDLLETSGLKLDISPQLEELQKFHTYTHSLPKLKQFQFSKLAIIGTPCQIYTIRCMQNLGITPSENVELCLGLFCYENFFFDQTQLCSFEKQFNVDVENIEKINIKQDLIVTLKDGSVKHVPFNQLNDYMRPACNACNDFTNIYADISFGGLGSEDKYTTILPRSDKGRSIILKAIKAGIINCKNLTSTDKEQLETLLIAQSKSKIKRKEEFLKELR